jgi:PhnB protein
MTFYQQCLGGELRFQAIGESPLADKMPAQMKNLILHSTLTNDKILLMGSDIVNDQGLTRGNAISIMLSCSSETDIQNFYENLSADGIKTHPLEKTFFGAILGNLTDKFGNHWLLHFQTNHSF